MSSSHFTTPPQAEDSINYPKTSKPANLSLQKDFVLIDPKEQLRVSKKFSSSSISLTTDF
jgi:hypothetical protein